MAGWRRIAVAGVASACVLIPVGQASAGSFGVREQSASAQGASYAGVAAGGQLSSMFWNPAVMTQYGGLSAEVSATGFIGQAHNYVTGGTLSALPYSSDDILKDALIPAMYASMQWSPNLWLGLSVNSPFGLSVTIPDMWPGRNYGLSTSLKTYNVTPSIAYRVNDWLSVGVGVQIEYGTINQDAGLTVAPPTTLNFHGAGWGLGATAGVTITPGPNTTIGIGWRSAINQDFNGSLSTPLPGGTPGSASTTLRLPDIVSAGLRQRMNERVTLLGTVEWTNWSRIGTSTIYQPNGAPALATTGATVENALEYRDGWLFSAGLEYAWLPNLTLRAGVGYEISPVTDSVRVPAIPDNNRTWVSGGLTYAVSPRLKLDLAYSHLFIDTATIAIEPGHPSYNGLVTYYGTAEGSIDLISVGLKYQFSPPPAPISSRG
jgi:long-chain fatty acid transport protein